MKNVLRKSALFIFALFILCMFMGCPSPVVESDDDDDSHVDTTLGYYIREIEFRGVNGEILKDSTAPTWDEMWVELEKVFTDTLNTAFGVGNWNESNGFYAQIDIASNMKLTDEKYNALKVAFDTKFLNINVKEHIFDFATTYDSINDKIIVNYEKAPAAEQYKIEKIEFVDENGTPLSGDTNPTWSEIFDKIKTIAEPAFNTYFPSSFSFSNTTSVVSFNSEQEVQHAQFLTLYNDLDTLFDEIEIGDYRYSFEPSYNENSKTIEIKLAKVPIIDSYHIAGINFYKNDAYGKMLTEYIWTAIEGKVSSYFDNFFGQVKWVKNDYSSYIKIKPESWREIFDLTHVQYTSLLALLDSLEYSVSGDVSDFSTEIVTEADGEITINVTFTVAPLAVGSLSDYYIVDGIYFNDAEGNKLSYSKWLDIDDVIEPKLESVLDRFLSPSDYYIYMCYSTIYDKFMTGEDYTSLIALLNSNLDGNIGSTFFDFTSVYDASKSRINITHSTSESDVEVKTFKAIQISSSGIQTTENVTAELVREGTHVELYLKQGQTMTDGDLDFVVNKFDAMYSTVTGRYGTHTDLDNNGKVIILFYDVNETLNANAGYVAGFFSPNDLTGDSSGNNAEILYVESQVPGDIENIFGTVIHEFQHLINWNMNAIENSKESDLWLNEALSASAEIYVLDELNGADLGPMMPASRYVTYAYPLEFGGLHELILKGNYFYSWDYTSNYEVLADYATVSLFMYWTTLYYDYSTIEAIANASAVNRGTYKAVVEAFNSSSKVISPVEWEDIMIAWLLDNEFSTVTLPDENGDDAVYYGYLGGLAGDYYEGKLQYVPVVLPSKIYTGATTEIFGLAPGDAMLTSKAITPVSDPSGVLYGGPVTADDSVYLVLNTDKTVALQNHPEVGIEIPAASIIPRSVQGSPLPPPPKVGNKIIPFSLLQDGGN